MSTIYFRIPLFSYFLIVPYRKIRHRGLTPEWVRWTVTGPSPAEGCFLMAGSFISGWACASPTLPGMMPFRVAFSTAPDPQRSGRVDILTHPYTTAACAAGVVTVTVGRDSLRCRCRGNRTTRQLALDCECN